MFKLFEKVFGSYSDRELKRIKPIVDKIDELEPQMQALSDEQLKAKTPEFKKRLGEGETLDDILPEAFAVVREASKRVLGMRHFRVQLIGGIVLHQGRIAEMKTGEGKTLVATLPVYLNALEGKGVHVVTVNDYLATRDSEWMGKLYNFLGLSVGLIVHGLNNEERRQAYSCDITYGTNNEYGFDYLRDNMVIYKQDMVQRDLHFAIVDEVDSILVDEARTPLIISGAGDKSTDLYTRADAFAKRLKVKVFTELDDKEQTDDIEADYIVDEKANTATLTAGGMRKAEEFFGIGNLSDPDNMTISHHINQALRANGLMKKDKDYVVKDGEVIIVDEFTGRLMYGRRYSNGLHQAIEAKEGVKVERESKTLASITFQNYFRMYKKLSGMTGTAQTEEEEFQSIYKLDVIVIPTNLPVARVDHHDSVYKNERGKFNAVIDQIVECNKKGQPVLIGTISIEKSELLSSMLKKRGVSHQVLNAKYHEKEAEIIAQAGKLGAVTIATNMAGRGTDIVLGGNAEYMAKQEMRKKGFSEDIINQATGFNDTNDMEILEARKVYRGLYEGFKEITNAEREKVVEAGGLFIIGTERHESRRIDNQLRGRAGRQGDPGESRFYISLEDDLMRLFGSDRLTGMVEALGLEEDQPIEHKMLTGAIENAQKRVEGKNFGIRKNVLQYDDVMNKQREVIYDQRKKVLNGENIKESIIKMMHGIADNIVNLFCSENPHPDFWDWEGIISYAEKAFVPEGTLNFPKDEMEDLNKEKLREVIIDSMLKRYEEKEWEFGSELMRELERVVLLRVVDQKWMDHIDDMEQLQNGVRLRAFGQKDPVIEYKIEGFEMFEEMNRNIQSDVVRIILNTHIDRNRMPQREKVAEPVTASHGGDEVKKPVVRKNKVGRNDPCPCGSGKKYKKCCGIDE
ncbi:preprotein translocase subunit SecA [Acetivibrio mesophilus]|uniref:Protein translocase subunit SecA n=1 Tax=Acetivibrio mesophilus TaxID=2487273 RepID=A0A4Q0I135_9FIRM|nr:preprotein translocase subunit SecA [Acetivibrio mesophilus]ODM26169.1 preprotein translocase subunit SecA [Clostridium sp. Bc-iso-3]RXE57771.1 preprotein translocase subunit SecA [Acetivibrio mesophilus]HHV29739.1 preprotein translocase subunit SecA [Clostridium sp.]